MDVIRPFSEGSETGSNDLKDLKYCFGLCLLGQNLSDPLIHFQLMLWLYTLGRVKAVFSLFHLHQQV